MHGFTIPTACGRAVLVRACFEGEATQIAVIGKRGSLVEAVAFDPTQRPSLIGALEQTGAQADEVAGIAFAQHHSDRERDLLDRLAEAEAEANATHCPNGHELTPENSYQKRPGVKGCRTCRRERSVWTREGGRLRPKRGRK